MFLVLTFPSSALGFIIVPKVFAYNESIRSTSDASRRKSKRGDARGSVWITGLQETPQEIDGRSGDTAPTGALRTSSYPVESHSSGTETQPSELSTTIPTQRHPSSANVTFEVTTTANSENSDEASASNGLALASQPQQAGSELKIRGIDEMSASQLPSSPE
jgi:hypothetical protein